MKALFIALVALAAALVLVPEKSQAYYSSFSCSIYSISCSSPMGGDSHSDHDSYGHDEHEDHDSHSGHDHGASINDSDRRFFTNMLISFINYRFFEPEPIVYQPISYQPMYYKPQPIQYQQPQYNYRPVSQPMNCLCQSSYQPTNLGSMYSNYGYTPSYSNPYSTSSFSNPYMSTSIGSPYMSMPSYPIYGGYGLGGGLDGGMSGGHFAGDGHNH